VQNNSEFPAENNMVKSIHYSTGSFFKIYKKL